MKIMEEIFEELDREEESTGSLDSDDPDRWGPYHWNEEASYDRVTGINKLNDYVKYFTFKTFRNLHFAGEVMVHFFGLHKTRYQWMIDIVEKDKADEEYQELIRAQKREVYALERDTVDTAKATALEGG